MSIRSKAVAALLFAACAGAHVSAMAGSVLGTKLTQIIVAEGAAFVYTEGPIVSGAACATYGNAPNINRMVITTSTPQGRAILTNAQLALALNKTVDVVGRAYFSATFPPADQCNVSTIDESVFFISVKKD